MTTSWLVLTVLAQTASVTYEPTPATDPAAAEAQPGQAQPQEAPPADEAPANDAQITIVEEPSEPPATAETDATAGTDSATSDETTAKITLIDRPEAPPRGRSLFRGAAELGALTLPSGVTNGRQDMFVNVLPILAVDTGDQFGFELGAVLRLRVFDDTPAQRADDYGRFLRREDWDERSDFGQILRELRLGADDAPVTLRAGPQELRTLGRGHVLNRYSNQLNPNYHPAGAAVALHVGPLQAEAFASDVLATRIFAGEVTLDIGRLASQAPEQHDRYHASFSAAYDFAGAGGETEPMQLVNLDVSAAIFKSQALQSFAYVGIGARPQSDFAIGGLLGFSLDAAIGPAQLGAKVEGRKVGAGFRFGAFGPTYELSRFSDVGLNLVGTSSARLPSDAFSGYGEVQVGFGGYQELGMTKSGALVASAAAEYFTTGRLDADAALTTRLADGKGAVTARLSAVDAIGETARWSGSAEGRYRFASSFYAMVQGGMLYFPQADRSLARGFFAGVGVGADFSH